MKISLNIVVSCRLVTRVWWGWRSQLTTRTASTVPRTTPSKKNILRWNNSWNHFITAGCLLTNARSARNQLSPKKVKPKHQESELWTETFIPSASNARWIVHWKFSDKLINILWLGLWSRAGLSHQRFWVLAYKTSCSLLQMLQKKTKWIRVGGGGLRSISH